jgi:hypothetical protein
LGLDQGQFPGCVGPMATPRWPLRHRKREHMDDNLLRATMTKARQRERKKRLQRTAAADRISAAADERVANEALVKNVDTLFHTLAEKAAAENDISIEDAVEGSWSLFEAGFLRIVARDDERVGIEPCRENRAEQRMQATKNKPVVELRRRLLAETKAAPSVEP